MSMRPMKLRRSVPCALARRAAPGSPRPGSARHRLACLGLLLAAALATPSQAADSRQAPGRQAAGKGHKPAAATAPTPTWSERDDVLQWAGAVAERNGLSRDWVMAQLAPARVLPRVQQLIMPPPAGTAKDWAAYRARFVEPRRIAAGAAFWRSHETWLRRAEERWGVPSEIIVGIIGVETFYGRITGSFRVLDALATLGFAFPSGRRDRSALFRSELEELMVLAHREGIDASSLRGSFAGAIGLPQFLPGSINRWAVDFDGDGHIDLQRSAADTIGSVAHYLAAFGWQQGLPTHYDVAVPVDAADRAVLLGPDILPTFTPEQFLQRGAMLPDAARAHDGLLALVELQNGPAAPSYVAGTSNFYAVTRYNWSSYYALAVIDLGAAIGREVRARP
jgi:membrane-bound lytic murein transglycosylase B